MTVSLDIDSFWQKLNERPVTKNRTKAKVVSNAGSAGSKPTSNPQVDHTDLHHLSLLPTSINTASGECKDLSLVSLEQRMKRPLQMLKDPAAAVRLRGLQSMRVGHCVHPTLYMPMAAHLDPTLMLQVVMFDTELQYSVMQEATEHVVAKPLLLCLGDKSEACREAAMNMLVSLLQVHNAWPAVTSPSGHLRPIQYIAVYIHIITLQAAPDAVIAILPYAIPVLEERLHAQEVCQMRTS